jgi:hypothetical protein
MVKMALVGWVNPVKFFRETSCTGPRHRKKIERDSARSRTNKESEWKNACEKYDDLSEKISSGTCICSFNRDGSRNVKGCTKC